MRPDPSSFTTSFLSVLHRLLPPFPPPRPHRPLTHHPLAFLFVCFSTRKKTRAFIFCSTRFLDNSFPVLLWGNKSAPPRVVRAKLRPLISGAGNEMRWLSSCAASLSWFPLFPCRIEAAGDGRGPFGGWGGGTTSRRFVLLRQLKRLYWKERKKKKLCDAVNFPHSACLLLHPS